VVNLAPHRDRSFDATEVIMPQMSPNRDLMAHFAANKDTDFQINFGPQLDEDGFQLHNVELL